MQSQERDLIEGLFNRLKAYESQPRDPEAERLIASLVGAQPGAPYLLTQTVLVQEQALKAAQQRISELEARAAAAAAPTGFLDSAPKIGPWGAAPAAAPAASPTAGAVPPSRSPLQAAVAPQGPGGGFLRSALTTAAGVAGGALLFEGIRNMFGHTVSPFGTQQVFIDEPAATPLMPSDQVNSADLAQDDGAADDYNTASDDDSAFDSGFDDSDNV
ncbi:hypothetical protein SAMN02745126_01103 [Enhydrobacter aerosaccus]|uniref:DUF2076 domain-containing protein n=1 Tax=Enhydrobacter aerosaccus TaxID=225324 RepID=A0A1T4KQR1_9HYPH|nr:DUF2076 domain-containing protein [Enhydrobacter aerosaccus]SJZ44754.1 hypothetical protein SAMN02745126_01103 [Enhydrobacter aerosaccus]